ncbi:MAG: VWA domain-containing protein [Proteobacteria bacterium]|nr:VWA domain-containing protein [Pseudomonadota bacterium]
MLTSLACQSTTFKNVNVAPSYDGQLTCTTKPPGAVLVGRAVEVLVQAPKDYSGRIQQMIQAPSSSKSFVLQKKGTTSQQMQRVDGKQNRFRFNSVGDYTVDLQSLDYDARLNNQCLINVYATCPRGTKRVGVHVAFVVDNSNSHVGSDCPQRKRVSGTGINAIYSCGERTFRSQSVLYAASILGEVSKSGGDSTSHVAFVSFPQPTATSAAQSAVWFHAHKELPLFAEKLEKLSSPGGVTPYWEGLQGVVDLFKSLDKDKRKVIFLVTDGFPTDQNPASTLRLAQKLKASGVKIFSVMVTGKHSQKRLRAQHTHYIRTNFPSHWATKHYPDEESYLLALLGDGSEKYPGLLRAMSDDVVYIETSGHLQNVMHGLVATEALECQKP